MEFVEKSLKAIEDLIPRVRVKYRDQLCFSGKKVSYDDFTKFLVNSQTKDIVPLWNFEGDSTGYKTVDFAPMLCIGIVELLDTVSEFDRCSNYKVYNDIMETFKLDDMCKTLDFASECKAMNDNPYEPFSCLLSARMVRRSFCWTTSQRLLMTLWLTYNLDKKFFTQCVIDLMRFIYQFISGFIYTQDEVKSMTLEGSSIIKSADIDWEKITKVGAIQYKHPISGKVIKLSNSRGLGIYSFALLLEAVYGRFGEPLSKMCVDIGCSSDSVIVKTKEKFFANIGVDNVGRYCLGKAMKIIFEAKSTSLNLLQKGVIPQYTSDTYTIDGKTVAREEYEDSIFLKRIYGLKQEKIFDLTSYYFTIDDLLGQLFLIVTQNEEILITDLSSYTGMFSNYYNTVREQLEQEYENKAIANQRKSEVAVEVISSKLESTIQDYEAKITELNRIVASKTNIIEQLSSEVSALNEKLQSHYSDEAYMNETATDSSVSLEDMICFLKDFSFIMIGGRDDLSAKLEKKGLINIKQVSTDERGLNGTSWKTDFFVLNTQFISHKLVSCFKERYSDQWDAMMYYNGTNVDGLITAMYRFVTEWFEKEA